jgi:hypothetical protein
MIKHLINSLATIVAMLTLAIGTMSFEVAIADDESTIYDTPILEFGLTKEKLISKESHQLISKVEDSKDLAYLFPKGIYRTLLFYDFDNGTLANVMALVMRDDKEQFSDDDMGLITRFLMGKYVIIAKDDKIYIDESGNLVFVNAEQPDSISLYLHVKIVKNAMAIFYSPTLHSHVRMEWEPIDEMKDIVQERWGGISLPKSPTPEMQHLESPTIHNSPHLDIKNISE